MRFYRKSEITELEKLVTPVFYSWASKWFSPNINFSINSIHPVDGSMDDFELVSGMYTSIKDNLLPLMFSGSFYEVSSAGNNILRKLWHMATEDISKKIHINSDLSSCISLTKHKAMGSGSLCLIFTINDNEVKFILSRGVFDRLLPQEYRLSSEKIYGMDEFYNDFNVRLDVTTNNLAIRFSELLNLKVGSVINLSHRVDVPLSVNISGKKVMNAFLAKSEKNKALVLEG